jgi:menaquinone-dependent protoporphyrinogen IX oxidase
MGWGLLRPFKMKRNILIVYFSQTGQLKRVVDSIAGPLSACEGLSVDWAAIKPIRPYPFPWPVLKFFDQLPESVHLVPADIEQMDIPTGKKYDLVILAHTVWYLSPPPAVTAFLQSARGRAVLDGAPVITVIACRNMWLMAHEQVKKMLALAGARHIDNVVLTDDCHPLASLITTPRWMLTGKTDRFFGMAAPGIKEEVIRDAARFGQAIRYALVNQKSKMNGPVLRGLRAVTVDTRLIFSETVGRRSFYIWGGLIRLCGPQGSLLRVPILLVYIIILLIMICTIAPFSILVQPLFQKLSPQRFAAIKAVLEEPSGSDHHRMGEYQ